MSFIVGSKLQNITTPSNDSGFCTLVGGTAEGGKICADTRPALVEEAARTGQPAYSRCPLSGLHSAAIPIKIGPNIPAFWILHQMKLGATDEALLRAAAEKTGLDFAELTDRVDALPEYSRAQFEDFVSFIEILCDDLVQVGRSQIQLKENNQRLRQLTEKAETSSNLLRLFIDSTDVALYVTDYDTGEVLLVNNRYLQFAGTTPEETIGAKCWTLGHPGAKTFCSYCPRAKLLDEEGLPTVPYRWENYNERFNTWLRMTNQVIVWNDGRLAHMVTFWDITQEHLMRDELSRLAFYDPQMELPNYVKLLQDIDTLRFRGDDEGAFLITFDIVAMHRLNDAYGRNVVDEMLRGITDWVQNQRYERSVLYRVEGDQFTLLLAGSCQQAAADIAREIQNRFTEAWVVHIGADEVTLLCDASISVISARTVAESGSPQSLIERTMDISRKEGTLVVYSEELDREAREHLQLEMSLKACVKNNMEGFSLNFQPIVDPAAGTWYALEALCRWNSPELGPVPPLTFIHEAEQLGLMGKLGIWVLETAIQACKTWELDQLDDFFLSVNLSPVQLMDEHLASRVHTLLKKYDYPGEKLSLEITESAELNFTNFSLSTIENLRFRGINIALDDFGTGYSSFNNLKNLPVRFLKTERDFIENIETDDYMQYFFYILSELAHATDMRLIAEGVETREQLEIILKNGADYVQGYYFSKPLKPEEVAERLHNFTKVNHDYYAIRSGPLEVSEFLGGNASYTITPRLFKMMNLCMQTLLSEPDFYKAVGEVLALVGESLAVSKVYMYEKIGGGHFEVHGSWDVRGAAYNKAQLGNVPDDEANHPLLTTLVEDGMIILADTLSMPAQLKLSHIGDEVKSVAILPLLLDDGLVGFVGLESSRFRDWLPEEIMMIRNLCMIMAACMKKEHMRSQIERKGLIFSEVMNRMNLLMYVAEPGTHKILWANNSLREFYQLPGDYIGRPCYELLWGRKTPCYECQVDELVKKPRRETAYPGDV